MRSLTQGDAAVRAVRPQLVPLRADVWGPVQRPLRLMRSLADSLPGFVFELSMRRSLASSLEAVERGELDVAFGRPHDLGRRWPPSVSRRLVSLEPIALGMVSTHPLADATAATAKDLGSTGLWLPFEDSPSELVGLLRSFADHLGVPVQASPLNLGVEHTLADLRRHPHRVTPLGAEWELPADIARIPLVPTPYLPWSVIWRADNAHPLLDALLAALDAPISFDPTRDWLPDADLADVARRGE